MNAGQLLSSVADFCYPSVCDLCAASAETMPLCGNCRAILDRLADTPGCEWCGFPLGQIGDPCPHCRGRGIFPISHVARLGVFGDPLRTLVHRIKYRHGWPLAEFLAERLASHPPARRLLDECDCLVAVPLYPIRQWVRGYNQAAVIAERLAKISGKPVRSPLVRLRNTQTQTTLHAQRRRWENLRGAFGLIDVKPVKGKHVALVDDVVTSGATVHFAAKALAAAGAATISVLAIAVADPKGRAFEFI